MDPISSQATKDVLKELKGLQCTSSLGPEALLMLASVGVKSVYGAQRFIWKMGGPGDFIVVIIEGLVEIRRFSGQNDEACLGFFGPSDVIGLSAVMNRKTYPAHAKTLAPGTAVLKLYIRPLLLATDSQSLELHTWAREMFLRHEQVLRDKIDILTAGSVEERVFEFFNQLARRFGHCDSKMKCRIPISLTRAQVGHMVNSRVETIIRLVSRWQKAGLLSWNKKEIRIENLRLLEMSLRNNPKLIHK